MKHIFIVNKISGKGQNMALMGYLKDVLLALGVDHEIRLTQYPRHAKAIAKEYADIEDVVLAEEDRLAVRADLIRSDQRYGLKTATRGHSYRFRQ